MSRCFAGMMLAVLGASCCGAAAAEPEWKVGMAQVKITPEQPLFMEGYASRDHPFEKVESDLYIKALVIEDREQHRAVLVTSDLVGIPAAVVEPICERIREKTGLKREQILINSSHIHTGPLLSLRPTPLPMRMTNADMERSIAYTRKLQDQIVEVVEKASAKLEPADFRWGFGVVDFVMNRREWAPTGVKLGFNPRGLADRSVPVLRIDGPDGKPRAVLFGAAVHNTTLRPQHMNICGDGRAGVLTEPGQIEIVDFLGVLPGRLVGLAVDDDGPFGPAALELGLRRLLGRRLFLLGLRGNRRRPRQREDGRQQ
jgi:hypothetical protein